MQTNLINTILHFWFGELDKQGRVQPEQAKKWWKKDKTFDALIKTKFLQQHQAAVNGDYDAWLETSKGRLALIILVDQFSRNMFRHDPQTYTYDHLALQWALDGLEQQQDQQLLPIERVFFYMPLEHSENIKHQNQCVALFEKLLNEVDTNQQETYKNFLNYAVAHQQVIEQFGRFPHRNKILGRINTDAELDYLNQPGVGF